MTNEYIEISNNEIIAEQDELQEDITELYDRLHALEVLAGRLAVSLRLACEQPTGPGADALRRLGWTWSPEAGWERPDEADRQERNRQLRLDFVRERLRVVTGCVVSDSISAFDRAITALTDQRNQARRERDEARSEVERLREERDGFAIEAMEARAKITALHEQVAQAEARGEYPSRTDRRFASLDADIAGLDDRVLLLEAGPRAAREEEPADEVNRPLHDLTRRQRDDAEAEMERMRAERDNAIRRAEDAEASEAMLREQLMSPEKDVVPTGAGADALLLMGWTYTSATGWTAPKEPAKLVAVRQPTGTEYYRMREERDRLRCERDAARSTEADLRQKWATSRNGLERVTQERDEHEQALASCRELLKLRTERLASEVERLREERDGFAIEAMEARAKITALHEQVAQAEEAKTRAESAERQLVESRRIRDELRKERDEALAVGGELMGQRADDRKLVCDCAQAIQERDEARADAAALREQIGGLKDRVAFLTTEGK